MELTKLNFPDRPHEICILHSGSTYMCWFCFGIKHTRFDIKHPPADLCADLFYLGVSKDWVVWGSSSRWCCVLLYNKKYSEAMKLN